MRPMQSFCATLRCDNGLNFYFVNTQDMLKPVDPITFGKKFPATQGMMFVTRVAEATRFVFTYALCRVTRRVWQ